MHAKKVLVTTIKILDLLINLSVRFPYFILAAVVIAGLTYLFGYHILISSLKGGDASFGFSHVEWYARWFPSIPVWYPLQGAGYSHTLSYAIGPSFITIVVSRLTGLDLVQSLRVVVFGSYLVATFGVYTFCAWRLKNQTVGLISAVLFLATPSIWFWIYKFGYYAFIITASLIPWYMSFFDWFLESLIKKQNLPWVILKLFLTALILGLAFILHAFVGSSLVIASFAYAPIAGYLTRRKWLSLRGVFTGVAGAFLVSLVTIFLFAFWFLPVRHYSKLAAAGGPQTDPAELLITWAKAHNIERLLFDQGPMEIGPVFLLPGFPKLLVYLLFLGIFFALVARHKVLGVAFLAWFFLFWSAAAAFINPNLVEKLRFVFTLIHYRALTVSQAFFPIAAAFAIYGVAWIITEIPFLPLYFLKLREKLIPGYLKGVLVSFLSLAIFVNLFFAYENGPNGEDFVGWGPTPDPINVEREFYDFPGYYFRTSKEAHKPSTTLLKLDHLRDLIENSYTYSFLERFRKDPFPISSDALTVEHIVNDITKHMQLDQFTRVGLTENIGNVLQDWPILVDASTLNQFHHQGSLFQSMRGYFSSVFFNKDKASHKEALLNDSARWLGYKYVVTHRDEDHQEHYKKPEWELIAKEGIWNIYEFKENDGLATITKRPLVLVIGKRQDAYENVFRSAASGVLPYENAWLVQGGERIDRYSLKELQEFDGLILYGYNYKSRNKTFSLLDRYIKGGGKVYIDTGWQFVSADWELEEAPDFFPVESLRWSTEIAPGKYDIKEEQARKLGVEEAPLEWEGKAWGISEGVGLRDWARPVLEIEDKIVIAQGNYGSGKIVLSGLNLFGYLSYHKYPDELVELGNSVFSELFSQEFKLENLPTLRLKREYPDRVEISINGAVGEGTKLLWREGQSPDWRVVLENGGKARLANYRAGPGFVLTLLPETKGSSRVVLEYKLGFIGFLGKLISFLTLVAFIGLILDQALFKGKGTKKLMYAFTSLKLVKKTQLHIRDPKATLRKIWHEEE